MLGFYSELYRGLCRPSVGGSIGGSVEGSVGGSVGPLTQSSDARSLHRLWALALGSGSGLQPGLWLMAQAWRCVVGSQIKACIYPGLLHSAFQ